MDDDDIMRCPMCNGEPGAADPEDRCVCDPERDVPAEAKPLYPELGEDLKRAGEQAARHRTGR